MLSDSFDWQHLPEGGTSSPGVKGLLLSQHLELGDIPAVRAHQEATPSLRLHMPLHVGSHPEGQSRRLAVILTVHNLTHTGRLGNWTFSHNCCDPAPALLANDSAELYQNRMLHRMRLQNSICCLLWFHETQPRHMWPNQLDSFKRFGGPFKTQPESNFSIWNSIRS